MIHAIKIFHTSIIIFVKSIIVKCKTNVCQVYGISRAYCLIGCNEFVTIQVGFMVKAVLGPDYEVFSLSSPLIRLALGATSKGHLSNYD